MILKICSKCKKGFSPSLEFFARDATRKDGLRSYCKGCRREEGRIYYQKHKAAKKQYHEYHREESKEWRNNRKDKRLQYNKTHRETINSAQREYYLNNLKDNFQHKVSTNISRRMRDSLKNKKHGLRWEFIVNYSLSELIKYIENQFVGIMNWENYGKIWHIDHKIPVAAYIFKAFNDIGFKNCWALKNLQPMLALENTSKKNRLDHPSQMGCFSTII